MARSTPWAPALIRIYRKAAADKGTLHLRAHSGSSPSDLSEGGTARRNDLGGRRRKKKGRAAALVPWLLDECPGALGKPDSGDQ